MTEMSDRCTSGRSRRQSPLDDIDDPRLIACQHLVEGTP